MKKLILAGAGHGHINVLKNLSKNPLDDCQISLITNFPRQYYSGMLSGFIEGIYSEDEISFDVEKLCREAKVDYILDEILEINSQEKVVKTKNSVYDYDYLSMNLGRDSKEFYKIDKSKSTYVKPISEIVRFKNILASDTDLKTNPKNLIIVGAGASGIELALSFKLAFPNLLITIITRGEKLLSKFNRPAQKIIKNTLKERHIKYSLGEELIRVGDDYIETNVGKRKYDYLLLSTGFSGDDISYVGFETNKQNYLIIDNYLKADQRSLAIGDMTSLKNYPDTPKTGVFAIKEGAILFENLKKLLVGEKNLKAYKPQTLYMQIINLGKKKAIISWGPLAFKGKSAWKIKDKIDRNYMETAFLKD